MKALKCKPSAQFAYNYGINVLSKYSNIISHQSSKANPTDTSTIDPRKSTHRSLIFEGRHTDQRSSKVDTTIVDLRRSTHQSSKIKGGNITPTTQHRTDNPSPRISSTAALHRLRTPIRVFIIIYYINCNSNTTCDPTRALVMYYTPIYIAYMR